jgi:oxygen-independent coproporphyrinogen-3 oxidase
MGRTAFGDGTTFARVVREAHRQGLTVSGDLLFNLPGQSLAEMRADVRQAVDIGLDHLGLYHLVLFRGLGTEWSRDRRMLEGLPSNEEAAENWMRLRETLLEAGFRQTTLTNFERAELEGDPRRFVYEEHAFRPSRHETIGFGPSAISFAADRAFRKARKTLNASSAAHYVAAVDSGRGAWARHFDFGPHDLRILCLTRGLASTRIDVAEYRALFGTDPTDDFPEELAVLEESGLLECAPEAIRPTPRGVFYADSIAGLLSHRQLASRRSGLERPAGPRRLAHPTADRAPRRRGRVGASVRGAVGRALAPVGSVVMVVGVLLLLPVLLGADAFFRGRHGNASGHM